MTDTKYMQNKKRAIERGEESVKIFIMNKYNKKRSREIILFF